MHRRGGRWPCDGGEIWILPSRKQGRVISRSCSISAPCRTEEAAFGWRPNPFADQEVPSFINETFVPVEIRINENPTGFHRFMDSICANPGPRGQRKGTE